ncbi:MAG: hypothetical protein IPM45_16780 [Acidimicrobiales bacterium]|nr:hypothetical protein [Acidimicrobiales bacterium]
MPVISEDAVRELASLKGENGPVTSCYLDVDGSRYLGHHDYQRQLDLMLRRVRSKPGLGSAVAADLDRIEAHVRRGVERAHVRGLAIFACSADGLWRVFELPVPVYSQIVVNHSPYVRQLELLVDEYERFGLLLADKQRARMFVFELGELIDRSELLDELPREFDDNRGHFWKTHQQSQLDEATLQHLRHAAAVAFHVFQGNGGFDRFLLGGTPEVTGDLERLLHPYLRERLVDHVQVPVNASLDQIRRAAHEAEERVERRREAELVARLRDAAGAGRKGVAGLDATLKALVQRRVEYLLVSQGFTAPGWRCEACGHLGMLGRACPGCGEQMAHVEDVVEEAVEEALAQHCKLEICVGNADLDVLGRIGALLRF